MNAALELILKGLISMFGQDRLWQAVVKLIERRTQIKLEKREETEVVRNLVIARKALRKALDLDRQQRRNERKLNNREVRASKREKKNTGTSDN